MYIQFTFILINMVYSFHKKTNNIINIYTHKKYRKISEHHRDHSKSTSLAICRFLTDWHHFFGRVPCPFFVNFKNTKVWICQPAIYYKFSKIIQKFSRNLVRSAILVALQPVDCKPVTLVKKELLLKFLKELL